MWRDFSAPWRAALEQAWEAYRDGSVPIGAVITDLNGSILAGGRNHIHDQNAPAGQIHSSSLAHAELNALLQIDRRKVDTHTCILYTTMEPCPLCMGAIYMMSVKSVQFAARDPYAGSTNQLGKTRYLSRKAIQVSGPLDTRVEDALIAILTDFHIRIFGQDRPELLQTVLQDWQAAIPQGVRLGRSLYQSGYLQQAANSNLTIAEVLEYIEDLLIHLE